MKQRTAGKETSENWIDALQTEISTFERELRFHDQASMLIQLLTRLDPASKQFPEARATATRALAGLAREIYIPEAIPAIMRQIGGTPWPENFTSERFRTMRSLGWWHALQGDYFNAFRSLKQAVAIAPDIISKTLVAADRAQLSRSIGETRWSRQELEDAAFFADSVDWKK